MDRPNAFSPRLNPAMTAGFLCIVLLQVGFLAVLSSATSDNPFGMMVAAALITPFVLLVLLLWPHAVLLALPPALLIPLWLLGISVAECLLLAVTFVAAVRSVASRGLPTRIHSFEWAYFLFVAWAFLTMVQVVDPLNGLLGIKKVVMLFLVFLAGRRLLGPQNAHSLLRVVAGLGIFIGAHIFFLIITRGYTIEALLTRFGDLTYLGWGISVFVAAVAALTTSASVPLVLHGRSWDRLLGTASLVSAVLVSIVTLARGATLAIALGLLVAAALEGKRRFLQVMGILFFASAVYLMSPLGQANLERFVSPKGMASVAIRISFYQEAFRIFRENPLLGVGPDQISSHTPLVEMGPYPHNFLLKFAADHGAPGVALYLLLLGFAAARARTLLKAASNRESRVLSLAFVLVLVAGVTNALVEPTIEAIIFGSLFWIMVGTLSSVAEALPRSEKLIR